MICVHNGVLPQKTIPKPFERNNYRQQLLLSYPVIFLCLSKRLSQAMCRVWQPICSQLAQLSSQTRISCISVQQKIIVETEYNHYRRCHQRLAQIIKRTLLHSSPLKSGSFVCQNTQRLCELCKSLDKPPEAVQKLEKYLHNQSAARLFLGSNFFLSSPAQVQSSLH